MEGKDQTKNDEYALAEAGQQSAAEKVLVDIGAPSKTGEFDKIESLLNRVKWFTDCHILQRYAQLITDKRDWPEGELNPESRPRAERNSTVETEIKKCDFG